MSVDSGHVTVIPDQQGRPLRAVLIAADGRSKEVDISQQEVNVQWTGVDVARYVDISQARAGSHRGGVPDRRVDGPSRGAVPDPGSKHPGGRCASAENRGRFRLDASAPSDSV